MHDGVKIILNGQELWLSSRRCLWWPAASTLVVADLHLGKGIAFCSTATLLPPYDVIDTLKRLKEVVEQTGAQRVICLGDNFHRRHSFLALKEAEQQMVNDLVRLVPAWVWVMGNHDPELPPQLEGAKVNYINDFPFGFYHQPDPGCINPVQVVGHYHPKYSTLIQGRRLSKPCFAWSETVFIMPSFGSYTGGLTINHPEIIKVLGQSFQIATADTHPQPILMSKKLIH